MFSDTVFPLFCGCETSIRSDQQADANNFTNFVALYNTLAEIEREKEGTAYRQSVDEIQDFWREEQKVRQGTPLRRRKKRRKTDVPPQISTATAS